MDRGVVMGPMPDMEMVGPALDLGRPELQELMDRYCSSSHETEASTMKPPTALIVTRHPGEEAALEEALAEEGWMMKTCAGPGAVNCPVMHGARCELRKSSDAAVVFVDANEFSSNLGAIPRLRCAADSSSPGIVVLEGSHEPPRFLGRSTTVGAQRGPKEILRTVKSVLDANG